jgi:asparagine synthase (glutamine-hydrolysing)
MALSQQAQVRTFTVGFRDEIDERPFARLVSDRYHTAHTELLAQARLGDEFERIYAYMDEPFADSSVIPTHVVARAAREHVKVVLTGDGGDELFAGYPMYVDQKYRSGSRARTFATRWLNEAAIRWFGRDVAATRAFRSRRAFASWHDTRSVCRPADLRDLVGERSDTPARFYRDRAADWPPGDSLTTAFHYDIDFYLPDDLLKKVDMASMRASLECRAPFLDHRLVEWSMRVPPGMKLRGDEPKWLLKRALTDVLPAPILRRAKQGFGAPLAAWLRGDLKTLALDLTAPGCRSEGLIPRPAIDASRKVLDSGTHDYRELARLWSIVVLEKWVRQYA